MSLGEKLCNARLAMKQTTSEVAAATRMKVQTVEYLEREEFDKIPAAIYAKGFIKLYAEHVGLDAAPLVDEYVARFSPNRPSGVAADAQPHAHKLVQTAPDGPADEALASEEGDLFDQLGPPAGSKPAYPSKTRTRPSLSDTWSRMADVLRRGWQALSPRKKVSTDDDAKTLKSFIATAMNGLSWRSVGMVALALVVLAFAASVATQCGRRPGTEPSIAAPPGEELRLAVEPPDPYVD